MQVIASGGTVFVLTVILSLLLAAAVAVAGAAKVAKVPAMQQAAGHVGYSMSAYQGIGAAELAGAAGLVLGLFVKWIGVLAALGLLVLFVLAVYTHVSKGDKPPAFAPAAGLAVLSLLVLLLRLGT